MEVKCPMCQTIFECDGTKEELEQMVDCPECGNAFVPGENEVPKNAEPDTVEEHVNEQEVGYSDHLLITGRARRYFQPAMAGDVVSQYCLAYCFEYGDGVTQDHSKALEWYQNASEQGYASAQYALGVAYRDGDGCEKDYPKALEWLQKSAEQGDQHAQDDLVELKSRILIQAKGIDIESGMAKYHYEKSMDGDITSLFLLARYYEDGFGVEKDYSKAMEYYQKAADQGHAGAQYALGYAYTDGKMVEEDYEKSILWRQKAAEQGHVSAQLSLGIIYEKGIIAERNYVKAMEWYQKAATQEPYHAQKALDRLECKLQMQADGIAFESEKVQDYYMEAVLGDATSQYLLACCYEKGDGVEKDYAKSIDWYHKAAQQGHTGAQFALGIAYKHGEIVEKDYAKAMEWYQKAAVQGDDAAQFALGIAYEYGEIVEKDYSKAMEWYHKAAEQGNRVAQFALGVAYEAGEMIEKNYAKAMEWYQKAAEQGLERAQCLLGYAYEKGEMIEKDYAKAMEWYQKAVEQGNENAQEKLAKLKCKLQMQAEGIDIEEGMAKCYYEEAVLGDATSQCFLASCYEKGDGVEKDYAKAMEWYQKAVEQGNENAQEKLAKLKCKLQMQADGITFESEEVQDYYVEAVLGDATSQCFLASYYEKGDGVEKDYVKAMEWYQKAAEQGDKNAQWHLGYAYEKGEMIEKDYAKAMEWYHKAAEQGHRVAQFHLGYAYEKGEMVEKDYVKAMEWYQKVAEQGNENVQEKLAKLKGKLQMQADGIAFESEKVQDYYMEAVLGDATSQYLLACCYEKGDGVEKDYAKAMEWYQKAAIQGKGAAQFALGIAYEYGEIVEKDYAKAFEWYQKAAAQGRDDLQDKLAELKNILQMQAEGIDIESGKAQNYYEDAMAGDVTCQYLLACCYENGDGVEKDYAKAMEWYQKAAVQGDDAAQFALGKAYEEGEMVTKDLDDAVYWYRKAAKQGNEAAKISLQMLNDTNDTNTINTNSVNPGSEATKSSSNSMSNANSPNCPPNGNGTIPNSTTPTNNTSNCGVGCITGIITGVILLLLFGTCTNSGSSNSGSSGKTRITGSNFIGTGTKEHFETLGTYAIQHDEEAFRRALLAGDVTHLQKGEEVYVIEKKWNGLIKVRRPGETQEWWTQLEAIK